MIRPSGRLRTAQEKDRRHLPAEASPLREHPAPHIQWHSESRLRWDRRVRHDSLSVEIVAFFQRRNVRGPQITCHGFYALPLVRDEVAISLYHRIYEALHFFTPAIQIDFPDRVRGASKLDLADQVDEQWQTEIPRLKSIRRVKNRCPDGAGL